MTDEGKRILTLPTLALRGAAIYPGMSMNFDVERPISIAALNAAIDADRMIFLVSQRDIEQDTPGEKDLYRVGVVCRLGQILRMSGSNTVRAIVDGVHRAKLLRLTSETPCFWANVQLLPELNFDREALETVALVRRCHEVMASYANLSGNVSTGVMLKLANKTDPVFLSDFIAQNVFLPPEDKQVPHHDLVALDLSKPCR